MSDDERYYGWPTRVLVYWSPHHDAEIIDQVSVRVAYGVMEIWDNVRDSPVRYIPLTSTHRVVVEPPPDRKDEVGLTWRYEPEPGRSDSP